jgi:hypothetical protein
MQAAVVSSTRHDIAQLPDIAQLRWLPHRVFVCLFCTNDIANNDYYVHHLVVQFQPA